MKQLVGKFSFVIPGVKGEEGAHANAGDKVEKPFEYQECETDTEAQAVITEKKWKLTDLVNDLLKSNARSNAYQAAVLPYRPSEVTPAEIKERMVRDFIRLGVPEAMARTQVDALLAAQSAAPTDSPSA